MATDNSGFVEHIARFASGLRLQALDAAAFAHSAAAAKAVEALKKGLSDRHGRTPRSKDYATSAPGELPYMHSGRLRDSVGYKVFLNKMEVNSEMGSGAVGVADPVVYADYVEHLRPFLQVGEQAGYNAENIAQLWAQKFNEGK